MMAANKVRYVSLTVRVFLYHHRFKDFFITRKEDILSVSTHIKENKNGHARETTDTFVCTLHTKC